MISNDIGSVARKGLWCNHERCQFHLGMATFWKAKNGCDKQFSNSSCDSYNVQWTKQKPSLKELLTKRVKKMMFVSETLEIVGITQRTGNW